LNKGRRAEIAAIILAIISMKQKVESCDVSDDIDGAKDDIRSVKFEEEECLNNMPENLEGCERYNAMEAAVDNLDDAIDALDDALTAIEDEEDAEEVAACLDDAIRRLEKAKE
jgi:ribosome assembly protein YihI (activator of Der GTPase)